MLIFGRSGDIYAFIHIPKNSGKYIRNQIKSDSENKIIRTYWGIDNQNNKDIAHIPLMLSSKYNSGFAINNFFAFVRNPYDRLISAFFYLNPKKNIFQFRMFAKTTLLHMEFNNFDPSNIHYYPQYKFLIDNLTDLKISNNVTIFKLENYNNEFLHFTDLNVKKYDLNDYYDNLTLKIADTIYSKDFELLGYQKYIK